MEYSCDALIYMVNLCEEKDNNINKSETKCSQSSYHATDLELQFNNMPMPDFNQWSIHACLYMRFLHKDGNEFKQINTAIFK